MDLNFSTSDFPGITDPVIYRAYESTNPTIMVADSGSIPAPHSAPANITIAGVNPIPHLIRCYQLAVGSGLGILKKSFWIDPTFHSYNGEEVYFYVVDGGVGADPVNGTRQIVDAYLNNKRYTVEIRDQGPLIYETAHTRDEYTQLTGGGFQISDPGFAFQPNQVICVRIQAQISSAVPIATSVSLFQDILTIDTDTNFSTMDWKKKLIDLASTTTRLVITLDYIATVPDNIMIPFISQSGNQINAVIKCQAGEKIRWNRNLYSELYLGIDEELWLTKKGGYYYVLKSDIGMKMVGCRLASLSPFSYMPNTIFPIGQLLQRLDYPRLWKFINDNPTLLIAEANWADTVTVNTEVLAKNKGFFTLGTTSSNFRIPDWRNRFFRTLLQTSGDTSRITQNIGGLQYSDNTPHDHFVVNNHSDTTNNPLTPTDYLDFQGEQNGNFKYTLRGSSNVPVNGLTSRNGTEGRPTNLAEYSLLYI